MASPARGPTEKHQNPRRVSSQIKDNHPAHRGHAHNSTHDMYVEEHAWIFAWILTLKRGSNNSCNSGGANNPNHQSQAALFTKSPTPQLYLYAPIRRISLTLPVQARETAYRTCIGAPATISRNLGLDTRQTRQVLYNKINLITIITTTTTRPIPSQQKLRLIIPTPTIMSMLHRMPLTTELRLLSAKRSIVLADQLLPTITNVEHISAKKI
ncbi:hypothetical protein N7466_005808 [Penicillium verhagenii]|uniref:uncharacterized protein n=1 Tax=Penicillium verhagenii TaxID=1562060 RepID=UPI00254578AE|nr:uncharacterized protein N7466_005808 [Penicillium verhagenii]KAJ5930315.1 hypothetical protein N7466_005808 [Penicillium verhagenii]